MAACSPLVQLENSSVAKPALFFTHTYTQTYKQTALRSTLSHWVHGMGSGLRGNEVTHILPPKHTHTHKDTLHEKKPLNKTQWQCSTIQASVHLSIKAVNLGEILIAPQHPRTETSTQLLRPRIFGPAGCYGNHPDVGLWLAVDGQMKSEEVW